MINNIEKLNFHDAYIRGINIVTQKDHFEQIVILLDSNEFINDFKTSRVSLEFANCYNADLQLQMWISGKDTIRELRFIDDSSSKEMNTINEMKEKGFIKKEDTFIRCEITLNTSGSNIIIFAKDVRVIPETTYESI